MRSAWVMLGVLLFLAGCSQPGDPDDGPTPTPGTSPFATPTPVNDTPLRPTPSNATRAEWTIGLTSAGPVSEANVKTYSISSASDGARYGWIAVLLEGSNLTFGGVEGCGLGPSSHWWACSGTTLLGAADEVTPGDTLSLRGSGVHLGGKRVQLVDSETGRVKLTITVE